MSLSDKKTSFIYCKIAIQSKQIYLRAKIKSQTIYRN